MARPRSDDKREAILAAAADLVAVHGLAAATARIAKQAGVAEGTLFTYFATKDDLLNELYLTLKTDLRDAMMAAYPADGCLTDRVRHVWNNYIDWGGAFPNKYKTMRQLAVSDRISSASIENGWKAFREIEALLGESVATLGLREPPPAFVAAIMEALADTTMRLAAAAPAEGDRYKQAGFEAMWRAIAAP